MIADFSVMVFLWLLLHLVLAVLGDEEVLIRTQLGLVRGTRHTLQKSKLWGSNIATAQIDSFISIPYAKPPIGELRFEKAQDFAPWGNNEVRNATLQAPRYSCLNLITHHIPEIVEQEDCLYLNVYSPFEAGTSGSVYPVMVYIHGGSYYSGTAHHYDGTLLASRGVVIVIINYRLGALGLLSSEDSHLPGNLAISDQITALKWVQRYVRDYRGDPTSVTIFGNSAGGSSVGVLLMSPQSDGLFHRAILQSGSPFSYWALHNQPADCNVGLRYRAYLNNVGCNHTEPSRVMQCLRQKTAEELNNMRLLPECVPLAVYMPRIDGDVITETPLSAFKDRRFHKVPTLIGCTRDEVAVMLHSFFKPLDIRNESFTNIVKHMFSARFPRFSNEIDMIEFEYTDWLNNTISNTTDRWIRLQQLITDFAVVAPSIQLADYVAQTKTPVWFYVFTHAHLPHEIPPVFLHGQLLERASNVSFAHHGYELNFVFGVDEDRAIPTDLLYNEIAAREYTFTADDRRVSDAMMIWWTNFAKYGAPSRSDDVMNVTWTPYDVSTKDYMEIDTRAFSVRQRYRQHKIHFWNDYMALRLKRTITAQLKSTSSESGSQISLPIWGFVVMCVTLCALVIILVTMVVKMRRQNTKNLRRNRGAVDI